MTTQSNQGWTAEELVNFSNALANGYGLGVKGTNVAKGDRWTAQRHIQASMLRGQAYL